jgi:ribosomal protein L35
MSQKRKRNLRGTSVLKSVAAVRIREALGDEGY